MLQRFQDFEDEKKVFSFFLCVWGMTKKATLATPNFGKPRRYWLNSGVAPKKKLPQTYPGATPNKKGRRTQAKICVKLFILIVYAWNILRLTNNDE